MKSPGKSSTLDGRTNLALMAPVKSGLVTAYESITFLERLKRLLDALQSSRRNQRESELYPRVFPDSIGRHGVIHSFRYAIWQPPSGGMPYLTLNVSFDGGWEPYMRVIYRDIGPLLDLLLCHCDGYQSSRILTFEAYCNWVRNNELRAGTFYTDSLSTAADAHYANALLESLLKASVEDAALAVANQALTPLAAQIEKAKAHAKNHLIDALALPLRTLKGLYRLAPLFDGDDEAALQRFAQLVLKEPLEIIAEARAQLAALPQPIPAAQLPPQAKVLELFESELNWVNQNRLPTTPPSREKPEEADIQKSVLVPTSDWTHGCMALLGVRNAKQAVDFIASLASRCELAPAPGVINLQVAFTHGGLEALSMDTQLLQAFPTEFIEGMEARSGILGDVRTNHPDAWRRPLRLDAAADSAQRIDLRAVHVVVVLRMVEADLHQYPLPVLHPKLGQAARELQILDQKSGKSSGLTLLAMEPMHSRAQAATQPGRLHFGFVDGLSQPALTAGANTSASDVVLPGELYLGYANARDHALDKNPASTPLPPLLQDGTFLVVRVLRQHVDRLEAVLDKVPVPQGVSQDGCRSDALSRMMGRTVDGKPRLDPSAPLVGANGFDFTADPTGRHCPFQSHVRRANPRDGRDYTPRILRRGMSYGPWYAKGDTAERGTFFMAYCASIAEQFETLQRWMAGGNSSGVSSLMADPFLGVPDPAHPDARVFTYRDDANTLQRLDLGAKPLIDLQWGLYLFVPSVKALKGLAGSVAAAPAAGVQVAALPAQGDLDTWRGLLEDRENSPAVWAAVRNQPGKTYRAEGYGKLVGGRNDVIAALGSQGSKELSVQGYGDRMKSSVGENYLGMDGNAHAAFAAVLNPIVQGVTEAMAFDRALDITGKVLGFFKALERPQGLAEGDDAIRRPIDLVALSEIVSAELCREWFGLPDVTLFHRPAPGALTPPCLPYAGGGVGTPPAGGPRCPRDVYSSSRTIFNPHPNTLASTRSVVQGPRLLEGVRQYLKQVPRADWGPLTQQIAAGLATVDAQYKVKDAQQKPDEQEELARNVAGMLLGFPPTVHANFLLTMKTWIEDETLWEHQQALAETKALAGHERAETVLRPRLMHTMSGCPVPETLWRRPLTKDGVDASPGNQVILGIRSAMAEPMTDAERSKLGELMFGGSLDPKSAIFGVHACPGYGMGVGVMLGMMAGLLDAGTLRPTGSPVLLMLTPRKP